MPPSLLGAQGQACHQKNVISDLIFLGVLKILNEHGHKFGTCIWWFQFLTKKVSGGSWRKADSMRKIKGRRIERIPPVYWPKRGGQCGVRGFIWTGPVDCGQRGTAQDDLPGLFQMCLTALAED